MSSPNLFLDTSFAQALINLRDQYHEVAKSLHHHFKTAPKVFVTDLILIEIADGLSAIDRAGAVAFLDECNYAKNIRIVNLNAPLYAKGVKLYASRADKTWGLTDCISFVVMEEQGLTEALTSDRHFTQAGFRALMLENSA